MALELTETGYVVTKGRYTGKTLEHVIKHGTHGGIDRLIDQLGEGEFDIFLAEHERQRPFGEGCPKCGMRTLHTVADGCLECQEEVVS